ncbi:amino acid adenylation domain-containing protein [Pseudonocardia tropica]|uniref:Amino acid adenylation domain-containing protein n=1 Tax=Pseudonocardia tropica TaxID=681289 RepID=A0ABV1JZM4_9PSEU
MSAPLRPTAAQQALWFAQQLDPAHPGYRTGGYLEIAGPVRPELFARAVAQVLDEAETLRLRFRADDDGAVVAHLDPAPADPLTVLDLTGEPDPRAAALAHVRAALARPVDLTGEPVGGQSLLRLGPRLWWWFRHAHHIAVDAYAWALIDRRTAEVYSALAAGRGPAGRPLPGLAALLDEDAGYRGSDREAADRAFWAHHLDGLGEVASPAGPVAAAPSPTFLRRDVALDAATTAGLTRLGETVGAGRVEAVLAAVALYVQRHAGGTGEVVLGVPFMGRLGSAAVRVPATAVNVLPLRVAPDPDAPVAATVAAVHAALAAVRPHARYRGEQIRRDLGRVGAGRRLTGPWVNIRPFGARPVFDGVAAVVHPVSAGPVEDLTLTLDEGPDGAALRLDANPALHSPDELDRHAERIAAFLTAVAGADAATAAGDLEVRAPAERDLGTADTGRALPADDVATLLCAALRDADPARPVVVGSGLSLGPAALLDRSARVAGALAARGIGADDVVALCLPRGPELVVAMLGVLRAGAAYLPLDPAVPARRIAHTLDDARPALLVTAPDSAPAASSRGGVTVTPLDRLTAAAPGAGPADPAPRPDGLAYVIYTSGSTGRPKGVEVRRAALLNFLRAMQRVVPLSPGERVLALTTVSFDIAVLELLLPLLSEATTVVAGREEVLDPELLAARIAGAGVTTVQATPTLWQSLLAARPDAADGLRVLVGGEALPEPLAAALTARAASVVNVYGPTETTVWSTAYPLTGEPGPPAVGRPVDNTGVHVLDARLRPVPPGVTGELYLSGEGLARGYRGRPGLTAERFVAAPDGPPGDRLYRTGDLARLRADGVLEVRGRTDHQVKVRGFRIELGEIEAVLGEHPGVRSAAVTARPRADGDVRLRAWVVPAPGADRDALPAALAAHCTAALPDYMVPAGVTVLDALPTTPHGKLDRAALPETAADPAPRGPTEVADPLTRSLLALMARVLDVPGLRPDQDFFAAGGHSLLVTRLTLAVRAELGRPLAVGEVFEHPTADGLAALLADRAPAAAGPPAPTGGRTRPDRLPAGPGQRRMWLLERLGGGAPGTYNLPLALDVSTADDPFDARVFEAALTDVVTRHEALRTVLREDPDGGLHQLVLPPAPVPLTEVGTDPVTEAARPFDPAVDRPLRATLHRRPGGVTVLLVAHHAAADEWSLGTVVADLAAAWTARRAGRDPGFVPAPQYADAAPADPGTDPAGLDFWRAELAGLPAEPPLPVPGPRPAVRSGAGAVTPFSLPAPVHARLRATAAAAGATVFMAVQAAVAVLTARLGGSDDVPLATPVAGRSDPSAVGAVGMFVNTVVLRTDVSGDPTWVELLGRVRAIDLAAFAHADVSFERVVAAVAPARSAAADPLAAVLVSRSEPLPATDGFTGLRVSARLLDTGTAKFPVTVDVGDGPGGVLVGHLEYATDLLDDDAARTLADRLTTLLTALADDPDGRVGAAPLLLPGERELLDRARRGPAVAVPAATLPVLFGAAAALDPQATAVHDADTVLTYAALAARVERWAHALREHGVRPGGIVAVALPRGADQVTALLAVARAGGAFLPLDPAHPRGRTAVVLDDARPTLGIGTPGATDPGHAGPNTADPGATGSGPADPGPADPDTPGSDVTRSGATVRTRWLDPAALDRAAAAPTDSAGSGGPHLDDPAYVLFTSGSTGRPKGVVVPHRGLASLVASVTGTLGAGPGVRASQFASPAVDVTVSELAATVLCGGTLVVVDEEHRLGPDLPRWLAGHGVTLTDLPPALVAELDPAALPAGATVVVGGEACPPSVVRRWAGRHRLVNAYGPTETTVTATAWTAPAGTTGPVLIGSPEPGRTADVLDARLRPVPPGVAGELYLGGDGLALGYLRRAGATAERFVAAPDGTRRYRTGDLVRRTPTGELEFLGRTDDQVQLRGFRVELGEVEAALGALPGVGQAAVAVHGDRPRLAGYVTAADPTAPPEPDALRVALADRLPEHMVPADLVVLDRLPLALGGKVDRSALPVPVGGPSGPHGSSGLSGAGPSTALEARIVGLLAEVLGIDPPGVHDGFFALGGDSIVAITLVARARDAGVRFTPREVFTHPTAAALATVARTDGPGGTAAEVHDAVSGPVASGPMVGWLAGLAGTGVPVARYAQAVVVAVPAGTGEASLRAALGAVLDRHDLLRARWTDGVLHVGGPAEPRLRTAGPDADVATELEREVAALRPADGGLFRAVLLPATPDGAGDDARLLLVVHHLVVDAVSWRILLHDLDAAARGTDLAPVPVSYDRWAAARTGAHSTGPSDSGPGSTGAGPTAEPLLGRRALDPGRDTVTTAGEVVVTLPADVTAALHGPAAATRAAGVDELLTGALAGAVARHRARRGEPVGPLLLAREGHGRDLPVRADRADRADRAPGHDVGRAAEGTADGAAGGTTGDSAPDLSRTVGWFTTLRTVRLDGAATDPDATGDMRVADTRRALRPGDAGGRAQILLNHLGRLGGGTGAHWEPLAQLPPLLTGGPATAAEPVALAVSVDPAMPLSHELEINSAVGPDGTFRAVLRFPTGVLDPATVTALAHDWLAGLRELADTSGPDTALVAPSPAELAGLRERVPDLVAVWPAAPLQQGLAYLAALGDDVYSVQQWLDLTPTRPGGPVDTGRVRAAVDALLERHPNLRAGFHQTVEGRIVAVVPATAAVPWREVDLSAGTPDHGDADDGGNDGAADTSAADDHAGSGGTGDAVAELARAELAAGFDPARPPLLRGLVVRLPGGTVRLLLTQHHLLLDGWSGPLVVAELQELLDEGTRAPAGPARPYREHLARLAALDPEPARAAWRDALTGLDAPTLVAADAGAPTAAPAAAPQRLAGRLPADLRDGLDRLGRDLGVTTSTIVQAAWGLLLARATGRTDVVFGGASSGRDPELAGVDRMVGLFVVTVPVRIRLDPAESGRALLRRVQAEQAALREHQQLPLAEIQRLAGLGTLFDTLVVFEGLPADPRSPGAGSGGIRISADPARDATHYPLGLVVVPAGPGAAPHLIVEHRPDVVDRAGAERVRDRLVALLRGLVADPDAPVGRAGAPGPAERAALLVRAAGPDAGGPGPSVPEALHAALGATADLPALVDGDVVLTGTDLRDRVHRLAALLAARGARAETRVALLLPRGADAVVALFATLAAGACAVPLDPAQPAARVAELLGDAAPGLVVTDRPGSAPDGVTELVLGTAATTGALAAATPLAPVPVRPGDAAYVLFTSGSTGRPKGVVVPHGALANLLAHQRVALHEPVRRRTGGRVRAALAAPLTFDTAWDALLWPASGHVLHLLDDTTRRDPELFVAAVDTHRIDYVDVAPTLAEQLAAAGLLTGPGHRPALLVIGGEAAGPALWETLRAAPDTESRNAYGPTEACVDTLVARVADSASPLVGHPVRGTRAFVLDPHLRPVDDGVPGELYLAGAALARGYLGAPGATAERFVADPFGPPGGRLYRTGDLVRTTPDGVEYLGRTDTQLSIRGYRVEPGEVEAALAGHPAVAAAVVVAHDNPVTGARQLVGHLVAAPGRTPDPDDVRAHVAARLPQHLVPAVLLVRDALPLTPNGKVDRRALPAPPSVVAPTPAPLGDGVTDRLRSLFAAALGVPVAGEHDSFFALGGDSIVSIRLVALARAQGLALTPRLVHELLTPAALAEALDRAPAAGADPQVVDDPVGAVEPTPVVRWLGGIADGGVDVSDYAQWTLLRLPPGIGTAVVADALAAVRAAHPLLGARWETGPAGRRLVVGPAADARPVPLREVTLAAGESLDGRATAEVAAETALLDPGAGAVLRAVVLRGYTGDTADAVALVAHHLVVDGVSWRIIAADLATAAAGRALPAPSTSFRRWAGLLAAARADATPWAALRGHTEPLLGDRPLDPGTDTAAGARTRTVVVDGDTAGAVLHDLPAAFHARVEDVLLTALALALCDGWRRLGTPAADGVLVQREGHGREEQLVAGPVDLSRTVGWFTTEHPVRLDPGLDAAGLAEAVAGGPAAGAALKRVKERLRTVPDGGAGFGLLPDRAAFAVPQVLVNYLGRFDPGRTPDGPWAPVGEAVRGTVPDAMPAGHALQVDVLATGDVLTATWTAPAGVLTEAALAGLAADWKRALHGLAAHVRGGAGGHSPSDLDLVSLDQDEIDEFENEWSDL